MNIFDLPPGSGTKMVLVRPFAWNINIGLVNWVFLFCCPGQRWDFFHVKSVCTLQAFFPEPEYHQTNKHLIKFDLKDLELPLSSQLACRFHRQNYAMLLCLITHSLCQCFARSRIVSVLSVKTFRRKSLESVIVSVSLLSFVQWHE